MTLPDAEPLARQRGPWHIAYAKPRQEKALADDLMRRELPFFLPLLMRETLSGGRRRRNRLPMFPSYVFYAGDDQVRLRALRTHRILSHLELAETQQRQLRRELVNLELGLRTAPPCAAARSASLPAEVLSP